ncbi:helix-turn-helix transcriptional regulator [Burkholderia multivorans]|jgi:DNA-binding CsgD family transcriptional regulator|uniref:LuxR family transcriptional regulator n=2 Tax=Burkholderia multivorans TaxID=87883 RepID=A0A8E2URT1_9BURK|nr:PAS domain-containing protein [Burkholderia multivorans]AJY14761.1 bacterial regulatory s, luxR family protein [Burkholderia multivorans ATCC BAA-247]AVR20118.1 LuxR family transcriptional regulator [Burkholderia multivorans]EJO60004.1 transcriptional regulator, LuxR family [Burkholderia multivorans ATCC BAA-247]KOE22594.1 LuxR family transcriptional regulator [Burkholderia multivorans R-20526]MBH9662964.1 LuxR family transcriptional regulator [Burkholderia multivorans]
MTTIRSADESIAALYAAAIDPEQWHVALQALVALADARAANCFVHDARTGRFLEYRFTGYGSGWADAYASHYHSLDLAREVLMREPAGRMYPMHRFLPDSVIDRSEYYQDFYIREGLRYSCGGMRLEGDRRLILAVHRPVNHRPYDAHTVRELQRVLDHLPNVFRVRETAAQTHDRAPMMAAALDALPRAVIVVDDTLRVRYLNAAASALLGESTELRVQADRLVASSPQVAPQLAQRVKDACAPPHVAAPQPLYALDRERRPTFEIQVVPLKPQLTASLDRDTRPLAMLLPRRPFRGAARPLAESAPFALTPAEMAVATGIAGGLTPAEYAQRNGVRISTVRSQIKSIFAKTGVRRIADLVALFGD